MASFLLIIGDRDALGWILSTGQMAFSAGRRNEVGALEIGDSLFIYTTRSAFKNPTRDRGRVIGTARVTSHVMSLAEPPEFYGRSFPQGCTLEITSLTPFGRGVELAPLVDSLEAFADAGPGWATRLRRALLRLSAADASLLTAHVSKRATVRIDEAVAEYTRWYTTPAV